MDMATTLSIRQHVKAIAVLCKWRVVLLMLLTAGIGMALAPNTLATPSSVIGGIMGIGLCACSGGVLNQLFERDIDLKMSRTKHRPLAQDTFSTQKALLLFITCILAGACLLYFLTNETTACLTVATMIGYGYIYTKLLKPYTSQNIVIGGLFGAMPPLLGWCAITGKIEPFPLLLVAIIYTWTPSHFWSLSLAQIEDYQKSPLPMLPVTHGIPCTQTQILLYTLLLILVTQLPYLLTYSSIYYLVLVNLANIWLLSAMIKVYQQPTKETCMRAFKRSNIYLMLVFLSLLVGKPL
jgi:protoheme IX farnesyltransferase